MARSIALFLALGCAEDTIVIDRDVTGVDLTVRFAGVLGLSGLDVDTFFGGAPHGEGQVVVPAGGSGPRSEDVVVLFSDDLAGQVVTFAVSGVGGAVRAEGRGDVMLARAALVDLEIELVSAVACGDGVTRDPESCDDGNAGDTDGCSASCKIEPGFACSGAPSTCASVCGDGLLVLGEGCDDGNTIAGDGCGAACDVEPGFVCTGAPSVCNRTCGDGALDIGEVCDDRNTAGGDGCSSACAVEPGFACVGEPSVCRETCGDGKLDPGELCDDANVSDGDGCSASCAVEPGFQCTGEPSVCEPTCGNLAMDPGEGCDDGNTSGGDGCSSVCDVETGFICGMPGPCIAVCGDGLIRSAELCDDGNTNPADGCSSLCRIEPGYVCSGEPSACTRCGNMMLDEGELCDGAMTRGATCLSRGHLTGVLGCNATCDDYDVSACGSLIDTIAEIQQAIDEAYAQAGGPEIVAIPAGTFAGNGDIVFDEQAARSGLILAPLNGAVTIVGVRFRVRTGNNLIAGFELRDAPRALLLERGLPGSGNNFVRNMLFSYATVGPQEIVVIQSNGNRLEASRFESTGNVSGGSAIVLDGAQRTIVSMNVVYGSFENAINLIDVPASASSLPTLIDQNSVYLPFPSTGTAFRVDTARELCFRNNILWGGGTSTGMDLGFVSPSNACPGGFGNNLNDNHATQCTGSSCFVCNLGPWCDLAGDPGFDQAPAAETAFLCLRPNGNPLVDAGLDLGYDMVDGNPALFLLNAPEAGAREADAGRNYGGIVTTCPP